MARFDIVQCQGCHGAGGETDVVFDGTGPWEACGFCQGTGRTTKMMNCWIMRWAGQRGPLTDDSPGLDASEADWQSHNAAMAAEQQDH